MPFAQIPQTLTFECCLLCHSFSLYTCVYIHTHNVSLPLPLSICIIYFSRAVRVSCRRNSPLLLKHTSVSDQPGMSFSRYPYGSLWVWQPLTSFKGNILKENGHPFKISTHPLHTHCRHSWSSYPTLLFLVLRRLSLSKIL